MSKNASDEGMDDKNTNHYQKALQSHFIAQWITSLAISVVCCAILFVVFAGYIVKLHEKTNIAEVRLEVLMSRHNQLQSDVAQLRRTPLVQINSPTPPQISQTGMEQQPPVATEGVPNEPVEAKPEDPGISLNPAEAATPSETAVPAEREKATAPAPKKEEPLDMPLIERKNDQLPIVR